jgi:hypothetical protein
LGYGDARLCARKIEACAFNGIQNGHYAVGFDVLGQEVSRTFNVDAVPEPSAFPLLAIGGVLLAAYGWRRLRA